VNVVRYRMYCALLLDSHLLSLTQREDTLLIPKVVFPPTTARCAMRGALTKEYIRRMVLELKLNQLKHPTRLCWAFISGPSCSKIGWAVQINVNFMPGTTQVTCQTNDGRCFLPSLFLWEVEDDMYLGSWTAAVAVLQKYVLRYL
jgi:hypothetical protein